MGSVFRGIPEKYAVKLKKTYGIDDFVETGSLNGRTALWAAKIFRHVDTIELNFRWYHKTKEKLKYTPNAHAHLGNSAEILGRILDKHKKPVLIWLDAHWSKDLGYQRPEFGECPVLDEIKAIKENGLNHVVLIDDARYFVNPPPSGHIKNQWPTLDEIKDAFGDSWEVKVIEDLDVIQVCKI